MGTFSIWHWLIVLAVVLVMFGGKGKISALMGDFGKGLKSFKKGMKDDEEVPTEDPPKILKSEQDSGDKSLQEKDQAAKG
ncbi:MAG: twin-arginine translocase TatA/TatE family subunit [Proteobacteria bacterium]|nr:twin-arginine translocase TatA/TatE family subunit [Pseudomonadota bacterium]